jgi:hypothetical protein
VKPPFRLDGEPHGDVCGRHENLAAEDATGPLEQRIEWHDERADARLDALNPKIEGSCEGGLFRQHRLESVDGDAFMKHGANDRTASSLG